MKNRCNHLIIAGGFLNLLLVIGCAPEQDKVTGSGIIEATEISVSPEISGKILELNVREGQSLHKDHLIARIDIEGLQLEYKAVSDTFYEIEAAETQAQSQISLAKTQVDGAHKNYERAKALKSKGSIPEQKYDDAETAYNLAVRQLETAKTSLATFQAKRKTLTSQLEILNYRMTKGIVTSPAEGVVIEKYFEPGEIAVPSKPLVKIADLQEVWVKIYLEETDIGKVRINAEAKISTDSFPERWFPGIAVWVSDTAEFTPKNVQTRKSRANLVFAVKILLENPNGVFKIGMPVDVLLEGFPEFS